MGMYSFGSDFPRNLILWTKCARGGCLGDVKHYGCFFEGGLDMEKSSKNNILNEISLFLLSSYQNLFFRSPVAFPRSQKISQSGKWLGVTKRKKRIRSSRKKWRTAAGTSKYNCFVFCLFADSLLKIASDIAWTNKVNQWFIFWVKLMILKIWNWFSGRNFKLVLSFFIKVYSSD